QRHSTEQQDQRSTHIARQLFPQRHHSGSDTLHLLWMLFYDPLRNVFDIRVGLLESYTTFQARDHGNEMIVVIGELFVAKRGGHPNAGVTLHQLKVSRHHAYHFIFLTIQHDAPTNYRLLPAVTSLPQAIANDRDFISASPVFLSRKVSTGERSHSEQRKKIRGNSECGDSFRLTVTGEIHVTRIERSHVFKRGLLCFPIVECAGCRIAPWESDNGHVFPDHYQ